jgi:alpha/beta superfamily hydrolase
MIKTIGWVLVGLACAAPSGAESRVEIAPELTGAWSVTTGTWDGRAVLLLHGMASDMDDAGGLFKRAAEMLAGRGIASLRINFRGEGDSKRTDLRSTAQTRREDALAALAFIAAQPGVAARRVGAVGWSVGCVTAIDVGASRPGALLSVALWSSPSGDVGALLANGYRPAYEQAMKDGAGTVEVPGWKTITLQRAFFDSYEGLVFERRLERFPGAVLFVRGSNDYLPHRDGELLKLAPGRPAEAVLLAGADHVFNVFDLRTSQAARVLEVERRQEL